MSVTIDAYVKKALENNQELLLLLPQGDVENLFPEDASIYPRVTFSILDETNTDFADGIAQAKEYRYQVDAWSMGNPNKIIDEIENAMIHAGFENQADSGIMCEEDTKIFHRARRYVIKILNQEEL